MSVCRRQGTLLVDSYVQTCIYSVSTMCGCVPEERSQADKTQISLPLSVYHAFQIPKVLSCLTAAWVTTHSKIGHFYLIPAPPEVVQCAVFINLCGRSAFLNPAASQEAFTYHHASFVWVFHLFSVFVSWYRTRKSYCPCLSLKSSWLEQSKSLLLHACCLVNHPHQGPKLSELNWSFIASLCVLYALKL